MAAVNAFSWPVRVYYEDTDGGGVVYHANYLKYMERARTEWLRRLGFEQTALRTEQQVLFVVRHLDMRFQLPAIFNDLVSVHTRLLQVGRSLLVFEQRIARDDVLLTLARVEVVCVHAQHFKPVSIPANIRLILNQMELA